MSSQLDTSACATGGSMSLTDRVTLPDTSVAGPALVYDDSGSTIAFNSGKALFFNYRYFESLHLPSAQQGKKAEAVVYWSVVMAHELAHNVVPDHSSQHSY